MAVAGAYYYLSGAPLHPADQQGNVAVIEMTTRQWRFDVVSVSGSVKVRTEPYRLFDRPSGEYANLTIAVRQGDTIILRIKNLDVAHGFGLLEFGVNVVTPPGETTEVKFVASRAGTFTFFCTVFCGTGHPLHKGTLIVE